MPHAAVPRLLESPRCVWEAGALLGEGTCWSVREQSLYWVDILGHRLFRYTPASGEKKHWEFDETISAVAERARHPGLIVTLQRCFAFFDPATASLQRLQAPEPDRPSNRFNDGKCDADGRFWAGTMDFGCTEPTGALYRYAPRSDAPADAARRGRESAASAGPRGAAGAGPEGPAADVSQGIAGSVVRALDARFPITNGPTWSVDGRTLYFTDTFAREIHAYDFDPESAALSNARLWRRFGTGDGNPDGMTTDAAGRIWIAHWGAGCISCHEPDGGAELMRVSLPTAHITNVAFGGPGLDTLYITSARSGLDEAQLRQQPLAGGLFAVRTDAVGCAAGLFGG